MRRKRTAKERAPVKKHALAKRECIFQETTGYKRIGNKFRKGNVT